MDISVNEGAINKAIKKEKYQQLKLCKPGIRARDAAQDLGISECELLTCRQGNGVVRLLKVMVLFVYWMIQRLFLIN